MSKGKKFFKNTTSKTGELLKKKWLRNTSTTVLLVVIIVLLYFQCNIIAQELNISDIDLTKEQIYSLSDETKTKIKDITDNVNIILINMSGYEEDYINYANNYSNENSNITIEQIDDLTSRADLMTEYSLDSTDSAIIVQCGEREKILGIDDLYTNEYTDTSYEKINITEEALTNAIIDVTTDDKPQVYLYLTHSAYSSLYFSTLTTSIENDANEVYELDLLTQGGVPEACDCLIVPTLVEDISEEEKNYLINYVNNGGNMVILQDATVVTNASLPNYQEVLDLYGVSISDGIVIEEDSNNTLADASSCLVEEANSYTSLTEDLNMNLTVCLMDSGVVEFKDEETLESLNITYEALIQTSETAFLLTDLESASYERSEDSIDATEAILGALVTKRIDDETQSKLIIYSSSLFATDRTIQMSSGTITSIGLYNNEDMIVNSVDYLTERENTITIRKKYGDLIDYSVTASQNSTILKIIYGVPLLILVLGIVVWLIRRNKK